MHAVNGNGKGGKGKNSKTGKGKHLVPSAEAPPYNAEATIEDQIFQAMPPAALARLEPRLLQDEWMQYATTYSEMGPGKICFARKDQLPELLQKVGHANLPTGVVITQHPREVGLLGYPSTPVHCTLWAPALQDNMAEAPILRKHLVQIGFGPPAQLNTTGQVTVSEAISTVKLTLSFSAAGGWRDEQVTAANVVAHIRKHVPDDEVLEVTARTDTTATVLVQKTSAEPLLRRSGRAHVYIKYTSDDTRHVLWLAPDTDHAAALEAAQDGTAFGLARTMYMGKE
eukprot:1330102-Amphidinium_carterae.1